MEPFAVVIRVHEADGDGNLSVAEGVVVRTRDGIEQAEVVETLAGDIAGSLHLTVFGVHCYVLSCHERYFNKKPDHTSEYDRALFFKRVAAERKDGLLLLNEIVDARHGSPHIVRKLLVRDAFAGFPEILHLVPENSTASGFSFSTSHSMRLSSAFS